MVSAPGQWVERLRRKRLTYLLHADSVTRVRQTNRVSMSLLVGFCKHQCQLVGDELHGAEGVEAAEVVAQRFTLDGVAFYPSVRRRAISGASSIGTNVQKRLTLRSSGSRD